jgi:hypothetical protein
MNIYAKIDWMVTRGDTTRSATNDATRNAIYDATYNTTYDAIHVATAVSMYEFLSDI